MAQDDRKGQPPATRGKSPAPSAPDTPDARNMIAPPPPEAPETRSVPESEAAGGGGNVATGGGGGESDSDRLRREIADAEKAVEAKKAELARVEEQRKAEEATAKMVGDYAAEIASLTAAEDGLRQYRLAETSFLGKFLDAAAMQAVANVAAGPQQEIDTLAAKIDQDTQAAGDKKRALDAAKPAAAAAKASADALQRPGASIRDRLKAADAIRAEAKKASDDGNYALAYWLIMDGGRLDQKVKAEPRILPASELEAAARQAAAQQAEAEQKAAALQDELKALEASLQADQARLAGLKATFETRVRASLAALNPKSAEAA
jgi:ATP-dependent Lon protease